MAEPVAGLLRESLHHLATDTPSGHRRLGGRPRAAPGDDRRRRRGVRAPRWRHGDGPDRAAPDPADVVIATSRAAILALLDAETSLAAAVGADQVRGAGFAGGCAPRLRRARRVRPRRRPERRGRPSCATGCFPRRAGEAMTAPPPTPAVPQAATDGARARRGRRGTHRRPRAGRPRIRRHRHRAASGRAHVGRSALPAARLSPCQARRAGRLPRSDLRPAPPPAVSTSRCGPSPDGGARPAARCARSPASTASASSRRTTCTSGISSSASRSTSAGWDVVGGNALRGR